MLVFPFIMILLFILICIVLIISLYFLKKKSYRTEKIENVDKEAIIQQQGEDVVKAVNYCPKCGAKLKENQSCCFECNTKFKK